MNPALEAMQDAFQLARKLPGGTCWGVLLTHDTEPENQAAFNIYVPNEDARVVMRQWLQLGLPSWENDTAESHDYTPRITLSIIEENRP
jgi:hypothetical protein